MIKRLALAVAVTFAPAVLAQTYIVAEGDCGDVTLHATRGTTFPSLGEAIETDRVAKVFVVPEGPPIAAKAVMAARSLDFSTTVGQEDRVVMASVQLTPTVVGNETRTEHAKTILFCGALAPAFDWQRSTGIGLEIYPQGWNGPRPKLKAGDSMRFIAVDSPTRTLLRDLPMELFGPTGNSVSGKPDPHGGMTFPYPEPGRYMVVASWRRPDPKQPEHILVDTSTLTFDVK